MRNPKTCYVCKNNITAYIPHLGGLKNVSEFLMKVDIIGSDVDNFKCPACGNHDRVRHLFMYFDALNLWQKMPGKNVLHIAPEDAISSKVIENHPSEYIRGDVEPRNDSTMIIDVSAIPYGDNHFDMIICNHVLEHVDDYLKAFVEIHRVLKPTGFAILQTPVSRLLKSHFEDDAINSNELRSYFYGATTHLRLFSEAHFLNELEEAGFALEVIPHSRLFTDSDAEVFGVNKKENLIMVHKLCVKQ